MKHYELAKCKRMALEMTQGELAELCGVTANTISRYERGEAVSEPLQFTVKNALERLIGRMNDEEKWEFEVVYRALTIPHLNEGEKVLSLTYLQMYISKLEISLIKRGL